METLIKEWETTLGKKRDRPLTNLNMPNGIFYTDNPNYVIKCLPNTIIRKGEPGTDKAMIKDDDLKSFCNSLDFNALGNVPDSQRTDAAKLLTQTLWEYIQKDETKPKPKIVKKNKKMSVKPLPTDLVNNKLIKRAVQNTIQFSSKISVDTRRKVREKRSEIKKRIGQTMDSEKLKVDNWVVHNKTVPRKQWPGKKITTSVMEKLLGSKDSNEAYEKLSKFFHDYYHCPVEKLDISNKKETRLEAIKRLEEENDKLRQRIQELTSSLAGSSGLEDSSGVDGSSGLEDSSSLAESLDGSVNPM